jgi:hypothetical protein
MADDAQSRSGAAAPLVALAGWIVPGAGYLLIGQRTRGIVVGVTILCLFVMGMLIAGIRVIDVPGYDELGRRQYVRIEQDVRGRMREAKSADPFPGPSSDNWRPAGQWQWVLWAHPFSEIFNKPWFVGQILAGPICLISANFSLDVARPANPGSLKPRIPKSHSRVAEIGTLYTAVAGMLNLLAIIDASYRAGQPQLRVESEAVPQPQGAQA